MSKRLSVALVPLALVSVLAFSAPAFAKRYTPPPSPPSPSVPPPPPATTVVSTTPTAPYVAPSVQCGAGGITSISRC